VESQHSLGIYLSKTTATVVCVSSSGRDGKIPGCFSVSVEEHDDANPQVLANLIARGCAERKLKFSKVAVALDCAMFMQHDVHSEFNDPKQIAATVRFDTEEAIAMDISEVAIAFKVISTDQNGSALTVFTAQQKILSDIILSLQANSIDPVTIEPDVNCLSRFLRKNVFLPEDLLTFFAVLSSRNGYIILSDEHAQSVVRTFLLGPTQDRAKLLAREIPLAGGLLKTDEPINCVKVLDTTSTVDYQQLSEKLGIEAGKIDLLESVGQAQELGEVSNPVDFAIAYGAAMAHPEKIQSINFRNDFMPYQGKKQRLQKALKFMSISVAVLVFILGVYFQTQLLQKNKYRSQLRKKLAEQYSAAMLDQKLPSNPIRKLGSELRRIRDVKSGQLSITGKKSVSAKLILVLEAFNRCAAQTNLNIDSISITPKTISIVGDTSSRKNTIKLRKAIEQSKLKILQDNLELKGGRDNFRITVAAATK